MGTLCQEFFKFQLKGTKMKIQQADANGFIKLKFEILLVSQYHCNKITVTGWLKTTVIYCLKVLRTQSLKSKQCLFFSGDSERICAISPLASGGFWQSWVFLGLQLHHSHRDSSVKSSASLGVLLSLRKFPFSWGYHSYLIWSPHYYCKTSSSLDYTCKDFLSKQGFIHRFSVDVILVRDTIQPSTGLFCAGKGESHC